jgi:ferrochelatase
MTRLQAHALTAALPGDFAVCFGMRYGNPSIGEAVDALTDAGADQLIVLPMYPQYSAASTATACDRLFQVLAVRRNMPAIRVVPPFFAHAAYIHAQAEVIRGELAKLEQPPQKFLFSFHGYPVDFVRKGDPYRDQVEVTAALLARELGLGDDDWLVTYQSRFGRQVWLEPYTEESLCKLARQGIRRVLLASPGFTTDCLETIDEIGREAADAFRQAGGELLVRCPCLNDHPAWIQAMRQIVLRESRGWISNDGRSHDATREFTEQLGGESTVLNIE